MCGICGVWEYGAARGNVGAELLASMSNVMTHRGPDDAGAQVFDDARGGFGFRRLSIIDLSAAGHQPMRGCTDRVWLVFNGEITTMQLCVKDWSNADTHTSPELTQKQFCTYTKIAVWIS